MKQKKKGESRKRNAPSFEALRARIARTVERPGVLVVTSAIANDGKSATAHGLAASLGLIGYRTLLIDAGVRKDALIRPAAGGTIAEMILESSRESVIPGLWMVSLSNPTRQEEAGHRGIVHAMSAVRGAFDYVVVDADCVLTSAFSGHFVTAADAVLVAVRAGRKQHAEDARLSETLENLGAQLFGVVAISPSIIDSGSLLVRLRGSEAVRDAQPSRHEREPFIAAVRPRIEL